MLPSGIAAAADSSFIRERHLRPRKEAREDRFSDERQRDIIQDTAPVQTTYRGGDTGAV